MLTEVEGQAVLHPLRTRILCFGDAGRLTLAAVCLLVSPALVAQSLQPGFFVHPSGTIHLDGARSGLVCTDGAGIRAVCEPAHRVYITGEETCDWSPAQQYPCTRFGYEFGYSDAAPGTNLDCTRTRYSPRTGEQTDTYRQAIDDASGRVFYSTFRTYAPVDERVILSEVHECAYGGTPVATIEFIIYYEPGVGGPVVNTDPYFPEVPDTCSAPYLTEDKARELLQAPGAQRHVSSDHTPILQSQCIYGAAGGGKGQVGYVFKFMLSDMFDVDRLSAQQIDFNATFANGGTAPEEILASPGRKAFIFRKGDRVTLFVITGIKGRADPVGRSNEFVAQYYIDQPDIDFASKRGALLEQAHLHMRHWRE
jgi:hypothetical protein